MRMDPNTAQHSLYKHIHILHYSDYDGVLQLPGYMYSHFLPRRQQLDKSVGVEEAEAAEAEAEAAEVVVGY